ncbi:hypothetical protein HMPREF0880_04276 [Yokenella regensburgei ATCC 43003]|nr:hypothetical protein HMPREF0880_04276 [Yokenella regensburgei ATCC 43003]
MRYLLRCSLQLTGYASVPLLTIYSINMKSINHRKKPLLSVDELV